MANDQKPPGAPVTVADLMKVLEELGEKLSKSTQEGIAMGMSMAAEIQAKSMAGSADLFARMAKEATSRPVQGHGPVCEECGQYEKGCKKEHVRMVVYPSTELGLKYFTGAHVNGVKYLSNNGGHKVTVPKSMASSIRGILERFEMQENEAALGRKFQHYSGTPMTFKPVEGDPFNRIG